jgi:tetratricopeptide (TPR) repeat protein
VSEMHITPELLEAVARGELSSRVLAAAVRDLRELVRMSARTRPTRIARANSRFRGVLLAELLLSEAKCSMPAYPQTVLELAEAAAAVLLRTPPAAGHFEALTRVYAYKANSLRARSDLQAADEQMGLTRRQLQSGETADLTLLAEVDAIEGVLRKDQRRLAEAEKLLFRSVGLYRHAGQTVEAARVLVVLGTVYAHQDDLTRAIDTNRAALESIDAEAEPRLSLCCRHNLSLFLVEAGDLESAADALQADEPLYRRFADPWTRLRKRWLDGKVAAGRGDIAAAEQAFLMVREGFLRQGVGYDAALVSLDLALLYLAEGWTYQVKQLALEMRPIFESEDIHQEALAALLLFEEAVRSEAATVQLVEEVAVYLKRARENPELAFSRTR